MVILDTHIWIWWAHEESHLKENQITAIRDNEKNGLGISVISCWEVAKLVEYKRIVLPIPLEEWFQKALSYPGITLINLTPEIVIESTRLPGNFHKDPADQMIVATARILDIPLVTSDTLIIDYEHVVTI